MKKVVLMFFTLSCYVCIAQSIKFKDAKSLSVKYFQCLLVNDTSQLNNEVINKEFILKESDYSLKGSKDSTRMDSILRAKYSNIQYECFFQPFIKLHSRLRRENITTGIIDSLKLVKIPPDPQTQGTEYLITSYFSANKRKFAFDIDLIEYREKWYLIKTESYLTGPWGYERTFKGDQLIEEHPIAQDSMIEHHNPR